MCELNPKFQALLDAGLLIFLTSKFPYATNRGRKKFSLI